MMYCFEIVNVVMLSISPVLGAMLSLRLTKKPLCSQMLIVIFVSSLMSSLIILKMAFFHPESITQLMVIVVGYVIVGAILEPIIINGSLHNCADNEYRCCHKSAVKKLFENQLSSR